MPSKLTLWSIIVSNLVIGNLIISILDRKFETAIAQIMLHGIFSVTAVSSLLLLHRFALKKPTSVSILLCSILAAFCVPTISIYLLFIGYGLYQLEIDILIKGIPFAIISGIVSWVLWMPMGLMNSIFFIYYAKKVETNS